MKIASLVLDKFIHPIHATAEDITIEWIGREQTDSPQTQHQMKETDDEEEELLRQLHSIVCQDGRP